MNIARYQWDIYKTEGSQPEVKVDSRKKKKIQNCRKFVGSVKKQWEISGKLR